MGTVITISPTDREPVVITGDGVYLGCTYDRLEGWYGVPGVDVGFVDRPNAPGVFAPERTYPRASVVSVEGQFFGGSRADALRMRETLSGLYADGRPVTVTVADDLRTTSRVMFVAGVELPWTIHQEFAFTLDLTGDDPRRYGAAEVVATTLEAPGTGLALPSNEAAGLGLALPSNEAAGLGLDLGSAGVDGRVVTANGGNAAATTRLVVVADLASSMPDGFVVVNVATGERLTYTGPVAAGTTVVLDPAIRNALINGVAPAGRFLVSPQWWTVPAGGSVQLAFLARGPVTGAPRLEASTAPAFY